MIATTEQVGWLGEVFGPRGVQLLSRVELGGSDKPGEGAHTLIAHAAQKPRCVQVVFPKKQGKNPFVFIHEMAHAYHAIHFPHLTEVTTVARAEACALLAEETLASYRPNDPRVKERALAWKQAAKVSEPIDLARQIVVLAVNSRIHYDVSLHDTFELILFGEFELDGSGTRH